MGRCSNLLNKTINKNNIIFFLAALELILVRFGQSVIIHRDKVYLEEET